jgi:hypothetical protein
MMGGSPRNLPPPEEACLSASGPPTKDRGRQSQYVIAHFGLRRINSLTSLGSTTNEIGEFAAARAAAAASHAGAASGSGRLHRRFFRFASVLGTYAFAGNGSGLGFESSFSVISRTDRYEGRNRLLRDRVAR